MQWLQDPNQSNVDNLKSVRDEASRHCRNKKVYLKVKIDELIARSEVSETCTNDFKKPDQLRTNTVKDEKGNMVADYHSILAWWRNHFYQLLNVHAVNDVK